MMQMRIIDVQQLDDLYSLSHPFLTCPETIHHLRQTKVGLACMKGVIDHMMLRHTFFQVMFLMRGLPGSGKSSQGVFVFTLSLD